MSSIREQIAENRIATARRMTQGAGYNFDWGSFYDGPGPSEPEEVPAFGYLDPEEQLDTKVHPIHDCRLRVEIKGTHMVPEAEYQYQVGRAMIADLKRNLMTDTECGGLCFDVVIHRADIFAQVPASNRVTVVLLCEIRYRTSLTDPNNRM